MPVGKNKEPGYRPGNEVTAVRPARSPCLPEGRAGSKGSVLPCEGAKRKGRLLSGLGRARKCHLSLSRPALPGRVARQGHGSVMRLWGADGMGEGPAPMKRPRKALERGCLSRNQLGWGGQVFLTRAQSAQKPIGQDQRPGHWGQVPGHLASSPEEPSDPLTRLNRFKN